MPFTWVPGAEAWLGVVPRGGDGTEVRWFRLDPCLVTHVLGAWERGRRGRREAGGRAARAARRAIVLYVCRYDALEAGGLRPGAVGRRARQGVGLTSIGGASPCSNDGA